MEKTLCDILNRTWGKHWKSMSISSLILASVIYCFNPPNLKTNETYSPLQQQTTQLSDGNTPIYNVNNN